MTSITPTSSSHRRSEGSSDDGCNSGDDLTVYKRGMPPRPPRYTLNFNNVQHQRQRLLSRERGLIPQLFPPPRGWDVRSIRHPMQHLPGHVVVHLDSVLAGFLFPLQSFHISLFRGLGIAPAQLVPNSHQIVAGFIIRCHDAGVVPSVKLFMHFFRLSSNGQTGYLNPVARPWRILFFNNP
ncbi:unnamed protein product [Cuscuta europaea]|uniref:Transposase (putative) gypsy type domain-containing protein n=1 Tax=Cuscuta europaea TaxID=41803 RepID=A0A9P0ZYX2_CUSEU|nr:unnamed protein product [Cuscuta europaea]